MTGIAYSQTPAPGDGTVLRSAVALPGMIRGGRVPFPIDPFQKRIITDERLSFAAAETVALPGGGTRTTTPLQAADDGWFRSRDLTGGAYVLATVERSQEETVLLQAQGHNLVYINGEPRAGDPYAYGNFSVPVRLKRGVNSFLFVCSRGQLRAELRPVTRPLILNAGDTTLPDLRDGQAGTCLAAIPLINTTTTTQSGLRLQAEVGRARIETRLPDLPPLSVTKVGFRFRNAPYSTDGKPELRLSLSDARKNQTADPVTIALRVRRRSEPYRKTFRSEIDGSVQYVAIYPAQKPSADNALVLSLHGASVEAIGQAEAYGPKTWATLVAPTNRRPFGFDWEDWGRLDATEVLEGAKREIPHDPRRVLLTGHSMGGHGTWSLGALFPDQFAAIGPSAGWISFFTYGGGQRAIPTSALSARTIPALVERTANVHDTLLFAENLLQPQVYVLHGDADDNVPVEQARQMRTHLTTLKHPSLQCHEEPGAGHWWDRSEAPGSDCVDWKPLFDLFQQARLPDSRAVTALSFTTLNPAVSSACHWVRIEQQEHALLPSVVRLQRERNGTTLRGTTQNIVRLTILLSRLGQPDRLKQVILDEQTLVLPSRKGNAVFLARQAGQWRVESRASKPAEKSPQRSGPFKNAFTNRFLLVYGTRGTAEENAWMYARARYDAETFLYRGNGSPGILSDLEFRRQQTTDRNVIVYGNATINAAWASLLREAPIRVERGRLQAGTLVRKGEDLMAVFLYPRLDSKTGLVGAVGGTGKTGMRLTERLPYFVSGAAFPDWAVGTPEILDRGNDGLLGAGYFGNDWGLETGDFACVPDETLTKKDGQCVEAWCRPHRFSAVCAGEGDDQGRFSGLIHRQAFFGVSSTAATRPTPSSAAPTRPRFRLAHV